MPKKIDLGLGFRAFDIKDVSQDSRTAEVVFASPTPVRRYDWRRGFTFMEVLSMDPAHVKLDRLKRAGPLLDSHDGYSVSRVLGVVEDASLDGKEGRAKVRFSKSAEGERAFTDVVDKVLRSVSVGYVVNKYEDITGDNDTLPVYRAVDWEPYEISIVPVPSDIEAGFRQGERVNSCEILTRAESRKTEEVVEMPEKTEVKAEVRDLPDVQKVTSDAIAAERKRASEIRTSVRKAGFDDVFANELIDAGDSLDLARSKIIDKLAEKDVETRNAVRVEFGDDERDKLRRGAEQAILVRSGTASIVEKATKEKVDPGQFRGVSMVSLARHCLEVIGERGGLMSDSEVVKRAITQTGSDFPIILENALNRTLQAAYQTTPDTWSRFCRVGSVTDFKVNKRLRLGSFGALDGLTEANEFKYKSIPDAKLETITASTKGNIINISRQALINDDLGAFSDLAMMLGRAAKLSVEVDVYALFALNSGNGPTMNDGNPLFHASHGNIAATAGAPSVATFDSVRTAMASLTDVSGNEVLDIRPAVWVGPIGLGGDARVVNDAQYDPDTANKLQKPNKVRGLFQDIVDTARLTGTAWYGFADPNMVPAFEVVFLNGQQEPYLESRDGWTVDGIETKVRLDYGVGAIDSNGVVKNAGA